MITILHEFQSGSPVMVNLSHVSVIRTHSESPNSNGVPLIGSKDPVKHGAIITFVLNGGTAAVQESPLDIYKTIEKWNNFAGVPAPDGKETAVQSL